MIKTAGKNETCAKADFLLDKVFHTCKYLSAFLEGKTYNQVKYQKGIKVSKTKRHSQSVLHEPNSLMPEWLNLLKA